MASILYSLFIHPVELLLSFFLTVSYQLTGSYGFSLLSVSLIVSLLLLPVHYLIERLQKKDKALQKELAPKVEDIKEVYKGYERHLYVKALYREHNYHPLSALKSSLGLLIQLPFLLAAYNLIAHFEPLRGVAFGPIGDLSKPDNLLSLGELSINLLPLIMTAVNLTGAYFYIKGQETKGGGGQMLFIALLFLVLLFNAPSGLLLYWTGTNLFSAVKYVIAYAKR